MQGADKSTQPRRSPHLNNVGRHHCLHMQFGVCQARIGYNVGTKQVYKVELFDITVGGRITVQLLSSLTRLDQKQRKKICCLFVCSEAAPYKIVKLQTSCTVILPLSASIICYQNVTFQRRRRTRRRQVGPTGPTTRSGCR